LIHQISHRLFAERPTDLLYHYTSLSGFIGIVESQVLRASDIRYMNDSAELKHTIHLLHEEISTRLSQGCEQTKLLNQLAQWLDHRIVSGPMLFGGSFRANGNLLSQWRGYSVHGKGISLGFNPDYIMACADAANFRVGKCIYDINEQKTLAAAIVDAILALAQQQNSRDYFEPVFEQVEGELLAIAAILKHPSFAEEQEWRIVSPVISTIAERPIYFREGKAMLVPYYAFALHLQGQAMQLHHVFVGPTNNNDLSMNSVKLFLAQKQMLPAAGIEYCQIPFRSR